MKRPTLRILTGATATGKTGLALAWAERFGAEIVSCDSLLFYRGMDIGTAKPTAAELARVRHHLVDVLEPAEAMDVKRYLGLARAAVADIEGRGRRVLVVGGSGFYLKAFLAPVTDDVPVDPELRASLEVRLAEAGLPALVGQLMALNPSGLGTLDTRNPRRVVRALERCLVSGRTLEELGRAFRAAPAPFADHDVEIVEVQRPEMELRARIAARAHAMVEAGLTEEVRRLRESGFEKNPSAAGAIGYRETLAWLDAGAGDAGPLVEAIAANTWRLVRKQRTWFRRQLPEHRIVVLRGEDPDEVRELFEPGSA